jgi:hypothetical protein
MKSRKTARHTSGRAASKATAENSVETTNQIYLEPDVLEALIRFGRALGLIVDQGAGGRAALRE